MHRTFLRVLLTTLALAPCDLSLVEAQRSDQGSLQPATPPRNGGTLDWATGQWRRNQLGSSPSATVGPGQAFLRRIYDNTCTWSGGMFFAQTRTCWERYDEGRIPSGLKMFDPPGATPCNLITGFTFSYCTSEAPGGVNVQLGFYEGLITSSVGGNCAGFQVTGDAPSGNGVGVPPLNLTGPRDLYFDLTGMALPADPAGGGSLQCWTVSIDLTNTPNGGFVFFADGEGAPNTDPNFDKFQYVWQQNGTTTQFGATGPFVAGDPASAPPGANTFSNPPGFDINNQPCGSGLDNADVFWINADGQKVGGGTVGIPCQPPGPQGSNCYSLGGWPGNPYASYYLRMFGRPRTGSDCLQASASFNVQTYCTAKTSVIGCVPEIGAIGQPSLTANNFNIQAAEIPSLRNGLLFYGFNGPAALPFQGGILCVAPPLRRTPPQNSGGNPPPGADCSGNFDFDFQAWALSDIDPLLMVGQEIHSQYWYRDPGSPIVLGGGTGAGLSNAAMFRWTP